LPNPLDAPVMSTVLAMVCYLLKFDESVMWSKKLGDHSPKAIERGHAMLV
jgi:hypothetical protein